MARFVRGDIVALPFPVSNKAGGKVRPALILASWPTASGTDYLACVISSTRPDDLSSIEIHSDDIDAGTLRDISYVRPHYLFTVDEPSITRRVGILKMEKREEALSMAAILLR